MLAVNSFTPKSLKCFSLKEEGLISQLSKISARLLLILSSIKCEQTHDQEEEYIFNDVRWNVKETEVLHKNVRSELVAFKQGLVFCAKSYYFKESSDNFINLKEA